MILSAANVLSTDMVFVGLAAIAALLTGQRRPWT